MAVLFVTCVNVPPFQSLMRHFVDKLTRSLHPSPSHRMIDLMAQFQQLTHSSENVNTSQSHIPSLLSSIVSLSPQCLDTFHEIHAFSALCSFGGTDRPDASCLFMETMSALVEVSPAVLSIASNRNDLLQFMHIQRTKESNAQSQLSSSKLSLSLCTYFTAFPGLLEGFPSLLLDFIGNAIGNQDESGTNARKALILLAKTENPLIIDTFLESTILSEIAILLQSAIAKYIPRDIQLKEEPSKVIYWIRYINSICSDTFPRVSQEFAQLMRQKVLEGEMRRRLTDMQENVVEMAMCLMRKLFVKGFDADPLRRQVLSFLMDVDGEPPLHLVRKINHLSESVSLEALSLFDCVIGTRHPLVFRILSTPDDVLVSPESFADGFDPSIFTKQAIETYQLDAFYRVSSWKECSSFVPQQNPSESNKFIQTVFQKLDKLYENAFPLNLRLTSILINMISYSSRIHPNLLNILSDLWKRGRRRLDQMQDSVTRLTLAMHFLQSKRQSTENRDIQLFLNGFIVLEEFLKEVYATLLCL